VKPLCPDGISIQVRDDFCDGYEPKPRDRRAEIEAEIYRLQARKWDNTTREEKDEVDGAIAALRFELDKLGPRLGNGKVPS